MIKDFKDLLTAFLAGHSDQLSKTSAASDMIQDACQRIERSWSGSFAGWHGKMYFNDFETPSIHQRFSGEWGGLHGIPAGWEEKEPEDVRVRIDGLIGNGFSIESFDVEIKALRTDAVGLRDELAIMFDSHDANDLTTKEGALLKQIEQWSFGRTRGDFIQDRLPGTLMSRDAEAVRQGTCIPSWLYYEGVALEGSVLSAAVRDLLAACERLIRSVERGKVGARGALSSSTHNSLAGLHSQIYSKCHELYEKKAYAEAVEKSFKVVRDTLRRLTGYETGSEAFGKGRLHIEGAAAANVEEDFNDAVKFLTMAIDRFRNEKSHTSDAKIDDPTRAYEYLSLSSLAMNLLENTRISP